MTALTFSSQAPCPLSVAGRYLRVDTMQRPGGCLRFGDCRECSCRLRHLLLRGGRSFGFRFFVGCARGKL